MVFIEFPSFMQTTLILLDHEAHPVFWAHISMLKGDLKCIDLLLKRDKEWKYVVNQPGTAFPIVPVNKLTRLLKGFKGPCDILPQRTTNKTDCFLDSIHSRRQTKHDIRFKYRYELK